MNTKIYIGCAAFALAMLGTPTWAQQLDQDSLVNVAFGQVAEEDLIYAVSQVNVEKLMKKSTSTNPLNNLSSLVSGYNGNIWGQSPLILIDGVPRDASLVSASEVESVTVLKDAAAIALYGSRGANGVVLITTKRGVEGPLTIDVRANYKAGFPKSYPKYLDGASYMTLYNEACVNDGKSPLYDAATIYNTAQGTNPYRYPDVDFFDSEYLRDFVSEGNAVAEIYGGTEKTRYYVNLGANYRNSLVKYGEHSKGNDFNFNVRGNVDMSISKWLTATTNAAVLIDDFYTGRGDFWGTSASLRPNWLSPLLPTSMMDPNNKTIQDFIATSTHLIDGNYLLGGTSSDQTNAFSEALAAGYTRQKYRKFLFDVTLNADLSAITEGLSFNTGYSVDYNAHYSEAYAQEYRTYAPTWGTINGQDMIVKLDPIRNDKTSTSEYVGQSTYHQTMMLRGQFDYKRTFGGVHNVYANLIGWGFQHQYSADSGHSSEGAYHRTSNVNAGLRLDYNFAHKYYVDFTGGFVHSAKLAEGHRNAFSPTAAIGWRLSEESFMKGLTFLNDLKITASYGHLHQDMSIEDYYLYKEDYQFSPGQGWYTWADGNVGGSTATSKRGGNENLTFITREEYRVGLDASLFGGMVDLNANYFHITNDGYLTTGASTLYPSFYNTGLGNFLPNANYNQARIEGFDYSVKFNHKFGDWDVTLGMVGMYYNSKAMKRDEVWEEDYLYRAGHALDASWGYVCEGFFRDQADIDNSPRQTFGTVRPGDLKYKDINEDGVIDSKDQVDLGKMGWSASPFVYGVNATVKYKNFTLFASGTGRSGSYYFKNNGYHWLRGTSKFSDVAWGRWTPETAETATYPALTTGNGDNNYRNSTFWLAKNDRFTLDNVQLTYELPASVFNRCFIQGASVYVGGTDLLMIAKEREDFEMNVGGEPQYRSVYLGFNVKI